MRFALCALLFLGSLVAQTETKGKVVSISYNSAGEATGFVLDANPGGETAFTVDNPSEQMTENLQRWKDLESPLLITDQDGDGNIEGGDTIVEA